MGAITCLYTDGIEGEHITVYMAGEKLDNLYKEIVLEQTCEIDKPTQKMHTAKYL